MQRRAPARSNKDYWASEPDLRRLAINIREKINNFRNAADTTGRRVLWSRAARTLYGLDPNGSFRNSRYVTFEGAEAETITFRVNLFRSFVKLMLVQTTGSRPPFACRPIAYDAETSETVDIGNAWLDHILNEGVEALAIDACLYCLYMGEGILASTWDDSAGRMVEYKDPETGQPIYDIDPETGRILTEGAPRILALRPDEVIRDPDIRGGTDKHRWVVLTVQRDRHELAARYPEFKQEILNAPVEQDIWLDGFLGVGLSHIQNWNNDQVLTYELYHRKTPSMPYGRASLMVGDTIIADGDLPYNNLPVAWMMSDRETGSPFGYPESADLLALSQVVDSVFAQLVTNRENYGESTIWTSNDTEWDPYNVGGLRLLVGGTKPEVLDLSEGGLTSGQIMINLLQQAFQQLSGMNSAVVGNGASSASGRSLAMQQALAAQFNSTNQYAYIHMFQTMLSQLLEIAKQFVQTSTLIRVSGKNKTPEVKRFKGEDLYCLEGVDVEIGSATMRTSGMRHEIADTLLSAKAIDAEQYLSVIASGRLEPILDGPKRLEIMSERLMQQVMEGRPYKVLPTYPHAHMIRLLSDLLTDPSQYNNIQQVNLISKLIQDHGTIWNNISVSPEGMAILAATGQQPSPGGQMQLQAMQQQAAQAVQNANPDNQRQTSQNGQGGSQPQPQPSGNQGNNPTQAGGPSGPDAASMPDLPPEAIPQA